MARWEAPGEAGSGGIGCRRQRSAAVEWRAGRRRHATGPGVGMGNMLSSANSSIPTLPTTPPLRTLPGTSVRFTPRAFPSRPQRFVHYTLCYYRTHRAEFLWQKLILKSNAEISGILFFQKENFKLWKKNIREYLFQK